MILHNHEKPVVLATVLGALVAPALLVALGAPVAVAAALALAVPFVALGHLEGCIEAHHRVFPTH